MKLKDITNGSDWMIWVVFAVFVLITILLLTGYGSNLIAGYNTASQLKREKYNEKKLCRVVGMGMLVITLLILIMAIGQNTLPAAMAYVFGAITLLDCGVMMILANSMDHNKAREK